MVIDTSAIFAAIAGEADSNDYRAAIVSAPVRLISAVTFLETQIVLFSRSGGSSIPILHELIERAEIAVVPFDEPMAKPPSMPSSVTARGGDIRRSSTSSIAPLMLSRRRAAFRCFSTDVPPFC